MSKVIIYELNEVPWKVIDFYVKNRSSSNIEKMLEDSSSFTTSTKD
mgnify:CR=1 FL=1